MDPVSRRTFFKQAGAAAAIAGGAVVAPVGLATTLAGAAPEAPLKPEEDLRNDEDLVAHVKDARTGEISLFIGNREVVIHEPKIAARLVRATRK
jgi:hypothetical protein